MKSDREFIDGIYQKAEELRKAEAQQAASRVEDPSGVLDSSKPTGGKVIRLRVLAGAAAAMLVLCIGTAAMRISKLQEQTDEPGMQMLRMLPDEYGVDPAAYTLDNTVFERFIMTGEVIRVNAPQSAKIGTAKEEFVEAVIKASDWLSAAPEGEPSEITVRYQHTDEYGWSVAFAQGEQVMLFLATDEDLGNGLYYLQEGSQSKYVFWKEEGNACYYKNAAGAVMDSRVVAAYQE